MTNDTLQLNALHITLLIVLTIALWQCWLYLVIPVHLAKFPWYGNYCKLYDEIKQVKTMLQYDMALDHYYQFTSCKKQAQTWEHKRCSKLLVKLFVKKYKELKNKNKAIVVNTANVDTTQILQLN